MEQYQNMYELATNLGVMIKERKTNPSLAETLEIEKMSKANYIDLFERGLISKKTLKERIKPMPVKLIKR